MEDDEIDVGVDDIDAIPVTTDLEGEDEGAATNDPKKFADDSLDYLEIEVEAPPLNAYEILLSKKKLK